MRFQARWLLFAAALWWGSLTMLGAVVVPLLFAHLPTPAMAGTLAAKLFSAQSWVSIGCALALLTALPRHTAAPMPSAQATIGFVLAGLLLALLLEHAVAPRILLRENLRLWHGAGTALYLVQWVCAGVVLWRQAK